MSHLAFVRGRQAQGAVTRRKVAAFLFAFFFEPLSPRPLAALRIGVATLLLVQALSIAGSLFDFFGDRGVLQLELGRHLAYEWFPQIAWISTPLARFGVSYNTCVVGTFLVYLIALGGLLLGWHTRIAAIIAWVLNFMFLSTNSASNYGVDQFHHIMLFYFTWMPVARSCSVDKQAGRVKAASDPSVTISLRLIQLHLCLVYLIAGLGKMKGEMWWNGEAIWRSLMLPEYNQYDFSWLTSVPWLAMLMCWSTLVIETLYPIFIWPQRTRFIWLLGVVSLHLGIAIFQGLEIFAAIMIVLTVGAFGVSSRLEDERLTGSLRADMAARMHAFLQTRGLPAQNRWIIFYDATCGGCNRFVLFVLRHDKKKQFYFAPLAGGAAATSILDRALVGNAASTMALLGPEGLYLRSRAVLKLFQLLGTPWDSLAKLSFLPTPILDCAYRVVAFNRRLLSRLIKQSCPILEREEAARIIV